MPLTFRQLEAFHAVMSAGSVTQAAGQLGVSQPAISRMLADLELNVGFPLFEKMARKLRPTERARMLHAEVERSLSGLAQIEAIADRLREQGEGQLRLAIVPSLVATICESVLTSFAEAHPAVSIIVETPTTLNALDWSSAAQADLGITFEPVALPGVSSELLGQTEAVCILPCGHALMQRASAITPSDLHGLPFVSYRLDSGFRAEVDRAFIAAKVQRDLRFEARTTAAVCEMVAATGGASIIPCPGPDIAADRRLGMLPFRPALSSAVTAVHAPGPPSRLARTFRAFLRSHPVDFMAALSPSLLQHP
jgi:DNA-binding transcriptional LysR family regulator